MILPVVVFLACASPIGTNLTRLSDYSAEWVFVDAFKQSRPWISGSADGKWDDGRPLDLDARGWVRSLGPGQVARTLMFWGDGALKYPAGRYVVRYEGEGAIRYGGGAKLVDAAPGRDVLEVDPARGGIELTITAVEPSRPLKNIRVLLPGFEDAPPGHAFHPTFLARLRGYGTLRFMDWMDTNYAQRSSWEQRPRPDDARFTAKGAPVEVMIDLANQLGVEPWFTLPHTADDAYIKGFASVVHERLSPKLRAWVEHSNEVWNGVFPQAAYARDEGVRLGLSRDPYEAQLRWHAQRSVRVFRIFESVFGGSDRVVRTMGSQAANPWVSRVLLEHGDAHRYVDAIAIAPYFGGQLGDADHWREVREWPLDRVMRELAGDALARATRSVDEQAATARGFGVDLVAYEGGQHLAGVELAARDDARLSALFDAANRDARMGTLYAKFLAHWRAAGGKTFVHFVNCDAHTKYGRWGALEWLEQPREQAPKYDALHDFAEQNPRWWREVKPKRMR